MDHFPVKANNDENNEFMKERMKSDLISKKLGELLLLGYRMLNETCDQCQCILMQKKNEPKYCVGCEDADIKSLDSKEPAEQKSLPNPVEKGSNKSSTHPKSATTKDSDYEETILVLRSKIDWARKELYSSNMSTTCAIELCELIKSAAGAIEAIEKLNLYR